MHDDIHPQIQEILSQMAALGIPKLQTLSTSAARELMEATAAARQENYPPPAIAEVENLSTGAGYGHVPVRVYRSSPEANAPAIIFFHGGGHVIGSLDSYDTVARFLALRTGTTLISVDYRMAPEHPFPAATDDCYDATRWVNDNADRLRIDKSKLVVCGDSAGGNLAAVVALMARDSADITLSAQVLVYPVIDYRGGTASSERYGSGYGVLETETVAWFMDRYLPDATQRDDWRACPRNAASHSRLPPALFIMAECDVLYDEGTAYAAQLKEAGVPVEQTDYRGMTHGFFNYLGLVDDAENAHQRIADYLSELWP